MLLSKRGITLATQHVALYSTLKRYWWLDHSNLGLLINSQKFYCLWQGTSKRDERRALGYMGIVTLERRKDFGKNGILENFQVPLNSLSSGNFGAFGGAMARAT